VKLLCSRGAEINWHDLPSHSLDKPGNTLLHLAEECEVIKFLVSAGLDINSVNDEGTFASINLTSQNRQI
jgi:ankyrin repeat protein